MNEQERGLRKINLTFYLTVVKFDILQDADSLISDIDLVSDWSYAIPYLIIEDEKEFWSGRQDKLAVSRLLFKN